MNEQRKLLRSTLGDCDQEGKPGQGIVDHREVLRVLVRSWDLGEIEVEQGRACPLCRTVLERRMSPE